MKDILDNGKNGSRHSGHILADTTYPLEFPTYLKLG
jgi:hypothetical protein